MDDADGRREPQTRSAFAVGLFDCSGGDGCLYGLCCPLCAIASSRTNLDQSSCIFNFVCINPVVTRWLVRSAYGIPGSDIEDCSVASCCIPCMASQLYQTTKQWGNPTTDAGRTANRNDWERSTCSCTEFGLCIYSFMCMPCGIGTALSTSVGMPFWMGCCCVNVCAARNIIRYQNRIRGSDIIDEMVVPICLMMFSSLISIAFPLAFFLCCPVLIDETMRLQRQSTKNPTISGRYLETQTTSNALAQQMAPMSTAINRVAPLRVPAVPFTPSNMGAYPQQSALEVGGFALQQSLGPVGMVYQSQPMSMTTMQSQQQSQANMGMGVPVYYSTLAPQPGAQSVSVNSQAPPSYAESMMGSSSRGNNNNMQQGGEITLSYAQPISAYSPAAQQYPIVQAQPIGGGSMNKYR